MDDLLLPVTLTKLVDELDLPARIVPTQADLSLFPLTRAKVWHAALPEQGRGTLLVLPRPSGDAAVAELRSFITGGGPSAWVFCGWSELDLAALGLSDTRHAVLAVDDPDSPAEIISALVQLTGPPNVAELRRLTAMQRSFSQALDQPDVVDELLRRLQRITDAVCLIVDPQGHVLASIGSLPLGLFLEQVRRTSAAVQHVSVEGWEGQALRLKGADPLQSQEGGWLIVAARRQDFPSSQDTAAMHIAATLVEAARRMQLSAQQQENAIRASIFDEALALSQRPDSPELSSRMGALGIDFGAPLRVVAASAGLHPTAASRAAAQKFQRALASAFESNEIPFLSTTRDATSIYLVQANVDTITRLLRIHRDSLGPLLFGIGREIDTIGDVSSAFADALIAIRTIQAGRHADQHMAFEEFDFATRLFASVGLESMVATSRRFLEPVLDREPMLQALRRYFEHDQNTNATADALGIHHNTLRYRLAKVEELLEVNLNDPAAIASLFLAITSLDLVELQATQRTRERAPSGKLSADDGITRSGPPESARQRTSSRFPNASKPPKARSY